MALLKAREAVMSTFIPHLRAHDLSPQQWRVLRALYQSAQTSDGELEMTALADSCALLMPSLSRIVQNLEQRELIRRRTSETDQRCSIIGITKTGTDLVELMAPQSEARYEHITDVFGYGKLELLYELLEELTVKLSDPKEPDETKPSATHD